MLSSVSSCWNGGASDVLSLGYQLHRLYLETATCFSTSYQYSLFLSMLLCKQDRRKNKNQLVFLNLKSVISASSSVTFNYLLLKRQSRACQTPAHGLDPAFYPNPFPLSSLLFKYSAASSFSSCIYGLYPSRPEHPYAHMGEERSSIAVEL